MTFPELLEAALTGTLNHPPPTLLAVDQSVSAERRMLHGASVDGLRWLAGRPVDQMELSPAPQPAEPETLREVPSAAAARLGDIFEEHPDVLVEWLQLVSERHLRVPPMYVPALLEHARSLDLDERELALQVGGTRMAWLAAFNSDWQFAACPDAEEQFASGSREQRVFALRRIRRKDPNRARVLLLEAWRSERAEARAELLEALTAGLSRADEDLLTRAVRDSRREVREVALRLIRRIPDSEFAARWRSRWHSVFVFVGGSLAVREPDEVDPAWVADGLDPRPPKNTGTIAWLLQQVVALTPPSVWTSDFLVTIERSEWRMPLRLGLADAAVAYMDVENVVRRLLDSDVAFALQLVTEGDTGWSLDFSQWLVGRLPEFVQKYYAAVAGVLRDAPWRLDPRVLPQVEVWLDAHREPLWLQPLLERLVETLEYRLTMRRELESASG